MSLADQQWCPTSVQVTVLQARGLRIKGKSGTNDAYAVMQVAKEKYQTSVVEKSVAPVWKEEATFDLPPLLQGGGGGGAERSTLHVHVLHRALVGPDKLLGQAVINLQQLNEDRTRNKTEWFKLLDKSGKPDKDRGEALVDIQFMRNNMTASMFDLSAAGKSRSRLGKFKDKVRGKKKESDSASSIVPSFSQILTDSEDEANGDGEAASKDRKSKKHKMKSLFSHKSNLQRNMSQSMSVLPAKNSSLSGSQSSGLNVESSEGKKKFKFMIHKRSSSSDSKDASSGHQKPVPVESNLCINGSHVYCEEPQPRSSRISSNFSLANSSHGSMEDVPENSPPSVDSLRAVRQYSPWMEEEEEEEEKDDVDGSKEEMEEHGGIEDEETLGNQEELEKLAKEKLRQEEEERRKLEEKDKREEDERIRKDEERLKREEEEQQRLSEDRRRREEQERQKLEEEDKRHREEEEKIRREEEKRRQEEERAEERRKEEEWKLAEEKRRLKEEERRIEEEKVRKEEEQRRKEEERAKEERRQKEAEEALVRKREADKMRKREEEERLMREERKIQEEEERLRKEKEEYERKTKEIKLMEERERIDAEKKLEEKMRMEKEMKRKEEEERSAKRQELEEKRRLEDQERRRVEQEKNLREEEERIRKGEEMKKEKEEMLKRQQKELERLAKEKLKQEEEMRKKVEEEKLKREEEERINKNEEMRRKVEEEKLKRQEEERIRKEEEIRRKVEEEKLKRQEEERIRKEKEMRKKVEEEKLKREEEERIRKEEEIRRKVEEEKLKRQEEERIRKEEEMRKEKEEMLKRQQEELEKLAKEKLKQEEEERRKVEEEKLKREEEERIRRQEEERARKEKKELERLEEEKMRKEKKRKEEEERIKNEEQEMIRKEKEQERARQERGKTERLAVETKRPQDQEKRIEGEDGVGGEERAGKERKGKEARKQGKDNLTREGEEQTKRESGTNEERGAGNKCITSTNPFDENVSYNPFEEISKSPSVPHSHTTEEETVQQRCQSSVSVVGSMATSTNEKDPITTQQEKRPAPLPPGKNQAERPRHKEQHVPTETLSQMNKQTKDVKTVSVLPQRSVQAITPQNPSLDSENTQSSVQNSASKITTAKQSRRPAPSRPSSVDEPSSESKTTSSGKISHIGASETKQVQVVYGLNPFEDDEDEDELIAEDDTTVSGNTGAVHWPAALSQTADKDSSTQVKLKSSKIAHAPPPPAKSDTTLGTLINQSNDEGHGTGNTGTTAPNNACDPPAEAKKRLHFQKSPNRVSPQTEVQNIVVAGVREEGPPPSSRRLQPVKPLSAPEQQSALVVKGEKDHRSTEILSGVQDKTKVNDGGMAGPYSQLTREELISLVLKQESKLSERDKTISELEQYIDNLLVRVIEEQPSILMSLNTLKKAA
ncbi:uncharacterized protein rab11fip1b [Odontesthes bonariensis]|uniref:uncharacterized protein rab11fip1b n=1 Tax=Odontesthes bonariensis TaxID=219752 RepID=UPI003F58F46A